MPIIFNALFNSLLLESSLQIIAKTEKKIDVFIIGDSCLYPQKYNF